MNYKLFILRGNERAAREYYWGTSWLRIFRLACRLLHAGDGNRRIGLTPYLDEREAERNASIVLGTLYAHMECTNIHRLDGAEFLRACSELRVYAANERPPKYIEKAYAKLRKGDTSRPERKTMPNLINALASAYKKGL